MLKSFEADGALGDDKRRSPDEAKRNPGISLAAPDFAALHPGYKPL
jgi:hypothetical protein